MQWKSLDKSTQVWLELNLVSVVTWAWWYRRNIRHYQECALEKSLLQTYSKWQANGDWFGEGGLLSMYPTCWGVLRSCWSVQIGNSCQLLSVCTQGYGSAPHSAWCYTQPSFFGAPWLSPDFMRYFCVGKSGQWVLKLLSISSRPRMSFTFSQHCSICCLLIWAATVPKFQPFISAHQGNMDETWLLVAE